MLASLTGHSRAVRRFPDRAPVRSPDRHAGRAPALAARWLALGVISIFVLGCGARNVWYGLSDDRRQKIEVWATGAHRFVELDGVQSPLYDAVGVGAVAFSPDGSRLVYAAERRGSWVLVVNGRESREWDGIGEVVFSPDSRRLAYAAESRGRWHVVVDGDVGPAWDGLLRGTLRFTGDGGRVVHVAERSGSVHVIIDGAVSPAYDGVGELMLSDDGEHVAYLARVGELAHVVLDGVMDSPYRRIRDLTFDRSGRLGYIATGTHGEAAVIDRVASPPHDLVKSLRLSPDGRGSAYVVSRRGVWSVVRDGVMGRSYDAIDRRGLVYSPEGENLAYSGRRDGGWYAVVDGREMGPYDDIEPVVFGGSDEPDRARWAYVARAARDRVVFLGGREGFREIDRGAWASNLRFSPGGERIAYLIRRDGVDSVVVDDEEFTGSPALDGSLIFSRDGRHWACIVADGSSGQFQIVIDGALQAPFDLVELMFFMTASPGGVVNPSASVDAIVAMLSAEVERLIADRDDGPDGAGSSRERVRASIAVAEPQPAETGSLFLPPRYLAMGVSLGFLAHDEDGISGETRPIGSVLLRAHARYAPGRRGAIHGGLTLGIQQPAGADEATVQGGHIGGSMAFTARLGLAGRVARGAMTDRAGAWTDGELGLRWRRRVLGSLVIESRFGIAVTALTFDPEGDGDGGRAGDDSFRVTDLIARTTLLHHSPRSRLALWIGTAFRLPLAQSSEVGDPVSGAMFDLSRSSELHAGVAIALSPQWNLAVGLRRVNRGDPARPQTRLPILDGGFTQQQATVGLTRRIGAGPLSPALELAGP